MPKKDKKRVGRAGHDAACDQSWDFPPWELTLALVPYRIGTKPVAAGTGFNGGDLAAKVELGKPKLIDTAAAADEIERKRFYEAMLKLPWLVPEIRYAVLRTLGRSYRAEELAANRGRDAALLYLVKEEEARLRANRGKRPRGGWGEAARTAIGWRTPIDSGIVLNA